MSARVQSDPFDLASELSGFGAGAGAVVTFTGIVRDDGGMLNALEIEHYPGMTERALTDHGLADWRIVHRHGRIPVGGQIMMVATAARHRRAAFDAADFLMDWLKSRAPFWKREIARDGTTGWVAARPEDEDALTRW